MSFQFFSLRPWQQAFYQCRNWVVSLADPFLSPEQVYELYRDLSLQLVLMGLMQNLDKISDSLDENSHQGVTNP